MAQLINVQQQMMTNNQERQEQQIERQRAHMEDQMRYIREKRDHEIELMTKKRRWRRRGSNEKDSRS